MNKTVKDLASYRLQQAVTCIKSAKILMEAEDYKGAANRSYYAIFHCMRAVLALEGIDFAKHSGVSAYFRKEYIKSGIFDIEFSDIIREAFDYRSDSDYDDFYLISKDEIDEQIQNAERFYDGVSCFVNSKLEAL